MTSISTRLLEGIPYALVEGTIGIFGGAALGFAYAKLADLPAGQAARAYAVWHAAQAIIGNLAHFLFRDNPQAQVFSALTISTTSMVIGIRELEKRGLIGQKLTIFYTLWQTAVVIFFLSKIIRMQSERTVQ